ncbi:MULTISPECIES: hypothetical protein [unclassified Cryobacterium]|uniref:DUF7255 family protein n=1 Tax=unclassified Cryobacterium TaxID=2649013 RepID=UPI00106D96AE|nr:MULTISPECIES: hypothetical protein [unclassified Cryobacterium]TFC54574.1 hypothetical protein E3O68_09565 [Cryobacterium sp. TMB3-1-2]TFC70844.1 hypothetical protein E3T21_09065 [Cryobacterium sp. TMB3-15]TFC77297.1 hypothetical protein E3T22_06185 [Cryobacterium sp. TMB3-10]TFD45231.1 hypothetical protein E3T58_02810 [Cryobacterium sp. TMB3-12]
MPVGDCESAFALKAAADGIVLTRARVPWLNQRGHLGVPDAPPAVLALLGAIFDSLGGRVEEQAAKRLTPLPGDFFHAQSGTFIEVDESQHFTSFRLLTLELYSPAARLGFDLRAYRGLCSEWAGRSDKYRKSKAAKGFGEGGRQRQRAYHDALRDLITPALGHPPVIRVAAPDRDGAAAYQRVRDRLQDCRPLG